MGLARSAASLLKGVPQQEELTPELLVRACEKAGLSAHIAAMPYRALSEQPSTVILELNDSELGVAVYERPTGNEQPRIILYDRQGQQLETDGVAERVQQAYTGRCIVVAPVAGQASQHEPRTRFFSSRIKTLLRKHTGMMRDLMLASLLVNVFALVIPLFTMNIYDRVVPNQAIETLWVLASGVVLILVFDLLLKLVRQSFVNRLGLRLELVLSAQILQHILSVKLQHLPPSVGSLSNQFREFEQLRHLFSAQSFITLVDLPFALLFLVLIYMLGGAMVWVPIVVGACLILYGFATHSSLRRISVQAQSEQAHKQSLLVETLASIETLKAHNAEGRAQGLWEQCVARLAPLNEQSRRLSERMASVAQCFIQLAVVASLVVGVYLFQDHALSLGALIACVLLVSRALAPMLQVAHVSVQLWQARQALASLDQLGALPQENGNVRRGIHREQWQGEIAIEGMHFAYEPGKPVLRDINLRIKPGEHVAFIGRIGSGKSSLFRLLMGFAEADAGQIRIDGIDVRHLDPVDVRQAIAYVPQDVRLIKGTMRDNLRLKSPQATDQELLQVLAQAGLSDLVQAHALGLDMPIGEDGWGLSGGQKQGVAIARALLAQPSMLLFDELTSAMDNQTEQEVIASIKQVSEGRTLLLSTHRATLLALVERVVVLDQGRVIADGPKDKVLDALKKGLIKTAHGQSGGKA